MPLTDLDIWNISKWIDPNSIWKFSKRFFQNCILYLEKELTKNAEKQKKWIWKSTFIDISIPKLYLRYFIINTHLTPQGQLSLQLFERMLKYFEKSPMRDRRKCKMQNFISFLMELILFEHFENFSYGAFYHLSKMSLQGAIVPGRLRSELCP